MGKLLLIGPQGAGKTTFLNSIKSEAMPPKQTNIPYDTFIKGMGIGVKVIDTAGSFTQILNNKETLTKLINESDCVAFIFNGKKFLDEIMNHYEAGAITSIIKNLLLPIWKANGEKACKKGLFNKQKKQLFFIANYNIDGKGNEKAEEFKIAKSDPKSLILSKMEEANDAYSAIAPGELRYPFISYFETNRFYCIDARNFQKVQYLKSVMMTK